MLNPEGENLDHGVCFYVIGAGFKNLEGIFPVGNSTIGNGNGSQDFIAKLR
jgi:hypothetical protein